MKVHSIPFEHKTIKYNQAHGAFESLKFIFGLWERFRAQYVASSILSKGGHHCCDHCSSAEPQ